MAAYERQRRQEEKLQQAGDLHAEFQHILTLHREEFTPATPPIAPAPKAVDAASLRSRREREAIRGLSVIHRSARATARKQATEAATAEIEQESARLQRAQIDLQRQLDEQWQELLANDPEVVFATLTEAFEDNEAPAAVAGVHGGEVSVVVLVPSIEMVPERMPKATAAGNLSLAKTTKSTRNSFYLLLVCGFVLVTVREALAVAPRLEAVRVVVVRHTPLNAYGTRGLECLLAAAFSRNALQGIQWDTADAATIVQDASTGLRIRQTAANAIQPLDLSGEPDLAALLRAVDLDEPHDNSEGKDEPLHRSDDWDYRTAGQDTRSQTKRSDAAVPQDQAQSVPLDGPASWRPRAGWGTIRDYVSVVNDHGGTDIGCRFVPDDGSEPTPIVLHDSNMPELGEYARAIMLSPDELSIRVPAASMIEAEEMFQRLNDMEPVERALMYKEENDLYGDCGWAWTPDYKLVRAAPGVAS